MRLLYKYQEGGTLLYTPKKRIGSRPNEDGTESTHLMMREYDKELGGWVVFPSLFQDPDGTWVDMKDTHKDGWGKNFKEAAKRGEVYRFGENELEARNFADRGSWKKQIYK